MFRVEKYLLGYYRVTCEGARRYGWIKKEGREWHAEIRRDSDGEIIRFAGIWSKKADAIEECEFLLRQSL